MKIMKNHENHEFSEIFHFPQKYYRLTHRRQVIRGARHRSGPLNCIVSNPTLFQAVQEATSELSSAESRWFLWIRN